MAFLRGMAGWRGTGRHRLARMLLLLALLLGALPGGTGPAYAGWRLVPGGQPARLGGLVVTPSAEWNQAGARPGKLGWTWTQDGIALNALELFAGVPDGQPLFRERSRKRDPMPRFEAGALLPELAEFFERSFRIRHALSDFTMLEAAPGTLGGQRALQLRFRYTLPGDDLARLGVARLAVVKGRLFAVVFTAPRLHYFGAGLAPAEALMDTARIE